MNWEDIFVALVAFVIIMTLFTLLAGLSDWLVELSARSRSSKSVSRGTHSDLIETIDVRKSDS